MIHVRAYKKQKKKTTVGEAQTTGLWAQSRSTAEPTYPGIRKNYPGGDGIVPSPEKKPFYAHTKYLLLVLLL